MLTESIPAEGGVQAVLISISVIDLNETFDRLGQLGNSLLDDMEAVSKSPCAILLRMPRMLRQGTLTCDCANPGSSREFGLRASSDHRVHDASAPRLEVRRAVHLLYAFVKVIASVAPWII